MTTELKALKTNCVGQNKFSRSIIDKLDEQGKKFAEFKQDQKRIQNLMTEL